MPPPDPTEPQLPSFRRAPGLAETVARYLRRTIAEGAFKPAQKLPSEASLAASFNVSRPIVREAISQLRFEGLVRSHQGAGVFVSETGASSLFSLAAHDLTDPRSLAQTYQLRMILELGAARLAARHRRHEHLTAMGCALADLEEAVEKGSDGVEADIAFHLSIADASGNEQLSGLMRMLCGAIRGSIAAARSNSLRSGIEIMRDVEGQHRRIFDAIRGGDETEADAAMFAHLRYTADQLRLTI
ncbi:MAG: FadR family transcriptional regulator [Alphaproteobacteria bacterium]|nr:FadR family transcriptional regulator [Alphaproteobacteria bacterium]